MPKHRRWTDDEMKNAIDLVLSGGSVHKTCKKYGIYCILYRLPIQPVSAKKFRRPIREERYTLHPK